MASERPIFVVGCPRSGTTLLSLMLSSHSRIAIPPETRFLLPIFRARQRFRDLRVEPNRRRLARRLVRPQGTKFAHLRLDPERVKKEIVEGPPTIGSALAAPYRLYAADRGKSRWGDKRPTYFRNVELLRALFPGAVIVHLVRDPRDCVGSLVRAEWWHHGAAGALATWVHAVDCTTAARRELPADAFHEIRYEDLVADPRAELTRLCAFLGEGFEEQMLSPHDEARQLPERQRTGWHRETLGTVTTRRVGAGAKVLTAEQLALVETVAGTRMRRLGYQTTAGGRPPLRLRLSYLASVTRLRVSTRALVLLDRRLAEQGGPVAALERP